MLLSVNLLLHVINCLLVHRWLGRLTPALLFAVHPLCAEPVNYVFARSTLLAAAFILLTLLDWRQRPWRSVAWLALALASKEDALAVPLVMVVFDWTLIAAPGLRWYNRLSRPLVAMMLLCGAAGAWSLWAAAATPGSGAGPQAGVALFDYWRLQGTVLARYLWTFAVPWGLTLDPALPAGWAWAGWMAVAAVAALGRNRYVWVALILLAPAAVVPLADPSADRRMYLSVAALAAALPARAAWLVPILAALSIRQTSIWRTEESLWRYVAAQAPGALRPQLQLSRAVSPAECRALLEPLTARWPEDARIHTELGRCALEEGDAARALAHFGRALALKPNDPAALHNRETAIRALTAR
jgi:tetratricopeptide (TPR) repeat protein